MFRKLCFSALAVPMLTIAMAAPAAAQQGGDAPPGNNGTIKIDDVSMDDGNENVPHPGCAFVVDFFGYDVGTRTATLEFEGQAPTGGGMLLTDTFTFEVTSRESGNQLNASRPIDLTEALAGIEPHPQQGWHVKLTAHVDGSQGADVKHKVFWISECEAAAAPAGEDVEIADVVPVPEAPAEVVAVESANVQAWNAAVWSNALAAGASGGGQPEAAVLSGSASAPAAASPAGSLPRTGAGTTWLLVAALAALATGGAFVTISRRTAAA